MMWGIQDLAALPEQDFKTFVSALSDLDEIKSLYGQLAFDKKRRQVVWEAWNKLAIMEFQVTPEEEGPLTSLFDRCPPKSEIKEIVRQGITDLKFNNG